MLHIGLLASHQNFVMFQFTNNRGNNFREQFLFLNTRWRYWAGYCGPLSMMESGGRATFLTTGT